MTAGMTVGTTDGMTGPGVRRVFLRDMTLLAAIGVHAHEHGGMQRVRVNIDLAVAEGADADQVGGDRLARVVDYERLAKAVRAIVAEGHIKLVETLAERIASACLDDARVIRARVRVEKLDVFADTGSVGVEVERRRQGGHSCISSTPAA